MNSLKMSPLEFDIIAAELRLVRELESLDSDSDGNNGEDDDDEASNRRRFRATVVDLCRSIRSFLRVFQQKKKRVQIDVVCPTKSSNPGLTCEQLQLLQKTFAAACCEYLQFKFYEIPGCTTLSFRPAGWTEDDEENATESDAVHIFV